MEDSDSVEVKPKSEDSNGEYDDDHRNRYNEEQQQPRVSDFWYNKYEHEAGKYWDLFYKRNMANFFKDRHYLTREFAVLADIARHLGNMRRQSSSCPDSDATRTMSTSTSTSAGNVAILELGCGAGNTLIPLMIEMTDIFETATKEERTGMQEEDDTEAMMMFYACDFSFRACKLTQDKVHELQQQQLNKRGDESGCNGRFADTKIFQCDLTASADSLVHAGIEERSIDVVLCIFVLSAMSPSSMLHAIHGIKTILKRKSEILSKCDSTETKKKYSGGGLVFVRDYAAGDLTEMRFTNKKNTQIRKLSDNFYVRGDGTVSLLRLVLFYSLHICSCEAFSTFIH